MTITNLKLGDIDLLRFSTFRQGKNTFNNIEVTKTSAGALHITTLGGKLMNRPCAKYIVTPLEENLWKEDSSKPVACTKNVRKVVPKAYGLKPGERNILSALPSNIVGSFLELEGNDGKDTDDDGRVPARFDAYTIWIEAVTYKPKLSYWKTLLLNLSMHLISGNI